MQEIEASHQPPSWPIHWCFGGGFLWIVRSTRSWSRPNWRGNRFSLRQLFCRCAL